MNRELPGSVRIGGYVLALALAFAAAYGVGKAAGPVSTDSTTDGHSTTGEHGVSTGSTTDEGGTAHAGHDVGGLTARADGFTLELDQPIARPGRTELAFTIRTSSGRPLMDYTESHEKDLHLIVVRRDLTGFQHVHPVLSDDGTWTTEVDLTPGTWRVVADLTPQGWDPITLADDLAVPGDFAPVALSADNRTAAVDDYTVHLTGDTAPGADTVLVAHVEKDGRPVSDLEPYLGAYGHLVAMRAGDLGYLHVHPEENGSTGPSIEFATAFPTHGTYRLFLDFKHEGRVRTAVFTVVSGGVPDGTTHGEEDDHDH
ncbi:MAG: hypothetical protein ACI379_16740 [Nocardioides sp.]|uniref:hypothetical protein n=1 Tax=Nocardioides sp. TaxID=35761 RepID=UPI003EFF8B45